ncbi:MAG: hypothetical protein KGV50_01815 [Gammaproteobacteria bacterium]|nr:hypothetical protein [Gammaproteobacteria bacterium]
MCRAYNGACCVYLLYWEVLLRSRAIENQCFVLAAAQYGLHPGNRKTWGHCMLIDSWEIL